LSNSRYGIGAVVNYCTNEYPFLSPCLSELEKFCARIVVVICDHFFDGTPENPVLIRRSIEENRHRAQFLTYPYSRDEDRGKAGKFYWEVKGRWLGCLELQDCEHIYFIDVDEIVESSKFIAWLEGFAVKMEVAGSGPRILTYRDIDALQFRAYWYFRDVIYRSTVLENSSMLIRRTRLTQNAVMSRQARHSLFKLTRGIHGDAITALDNTPMVHHYSWVRTKEQMLRKVLSWTHSSDRDWVPLVEKEFSSQTFSGVDFVHGYSFEIVNPYVKIDLGL